MLAEIFIANNKYVYCNLQVHFIIELNKYSVKYMFFRFITSMGLKALCSSGTIDILKFKAKIKYFDKSNGEIT